MREREGGENKGRGRMNVVVQLAVWACLQLLFLFDMWNGGLVASREEEVGGGLYSSLLSSLSFFEIKYRCHFSFSLAAIS